MLETQVKIIKTFSEVKQLAQYCIDTGYCCLDFETTTEEDAGAFHNPNGYPTVLGVSFQPFSGWVIPLGHFASPFKNNYVKILKYFAKRVLENPRVTKIAYNIKYEMKWLYKYDIKLAGRIFDVMLMKYLLDEDRPNDLKSLTTRIMPERGGYENYEGSKLPWDKKPLEPLSTYCARDCDNTLLIYLTLLPRIIKGGFYNLLRNMMMPATWVLSEAEYHGMEIDVPYLTTLREKYQIDLTNLDVELQSHKVIKRYYQERKIEIRAKLIEGVEYELAVLNEELKDAAKAKDSRKYNTTYRKIDNRQQKLADYKQWKFRTNKDNKLFEPVNFNSPKQLIELLFTHRKGFNFDIVAYTIDKKTKKETKTPSTGEEVLLELDKLDDSGFMKLLLKHRSISKLYSTYVDGMYQKLSVNSRIHGSFLLHGTVTGRLCISDSGMLKTNMGDFSIKYLCPSKPGVIPIDYDCKVLTHNGNYKQILYGVNKGEEDMYEVELEDGRKIECTIGHMFLTDKGWVPLRDIINNTTAFKIKATV